MAKINIKIDGIKEFKAKMRNRRRELNAGLREILESVADTSLKRLKASTPVKTGATQSLWKKINVQLSALRSSTIRIDIDHAFNIPGAIHPKNGRPVNSDTFNLLKHLEFRTNGSNLQVRVTTEFARALLKKRVAGLIAKIRE